MGETPFTERELNVLSVLWRRGSATVAEVREALGQELAYTHVLKILQVLEQKGAVGHEAEGRAYRYHPLVEPASAAGPALRRILDKIFMGSASAMLARLVDDTEPSAEALARLRRLLDDAASRRDAEPGPERRDEEDRR